MEATRTVAEVVAQQEDAKLRHIVSLEVLRHCVWYVLPLHVLVVLQHKLPGTPQCPGNSSIP